MAELIHQDAERVCAQLQADAESDDSNTPMDSPEDSLGVMAGSIMTDSLMTGSIMSDSLISNLIGDKDIASPSDVLSPSGGASLADAISLSKKTSPIPVSESQQLLVDLTEGHLKQQRPLSVLSSDSVDTGIADVLGQPRCTSNGLCLDTLDENPVRSERPISTCSADTGIASDYGGRPLSMVSTLSSIDNGKFDNIYFLALFHNKENVALQILK